MVKALAVLFAAMAVYALAVGALGAAMISLAMVCFMIIGDREFKRQDQQTVKTVVPTQTQLDLDHCESSGPGQQ